MARFLVLDAILFLVPFVAYAALLLFTRGSLSDVEDWQARTIAVLAIAGAGMLLTALVVFTSFRAIPPGGTYVPAHIEDGKIIPGQIVRQPADPS